MTPTDIDPVAVERACDGDRTVHLNSAEVAAAVAHLQARHLNFMQISRLLGISDRTAYRIASGKTAVPCSRPGRRAAS
jgi:hypothetical protein